MLGGSAFVAFIPVRDLVTARPFYEQTLGLRVIDETPFALVLDADGTQVRLTPVPDFTPAGFTVAGWTVGDITATVRSLAEAGVTFRRYEGMDQDESGIWTSPSGDRVAWFADPEGNTLSVTAVASP